jgi:hypothetical protein
MHTSLQAHEDPLAVTSKLYWYPFSMSRHPCGIAQFIKATKEKKTEHIYIDVPQTEPERPFCQHLVFSVMIKLVVHPGQQSTFGTYPLDNIKTLLVEQTIRLIRHGDRLQSATNHAKRVLVNLRYYVLLVWILE